MNREIAASPQKIPCRFRSLDSRKNGKKKAIALVAEPSLSGIQALSFCNIQLGNEGAAALAASPYLSGLHHLFLSNCGISFTGVKALATSPYFKDLWSLVMDDNPITEEGADTLFAPDHKTRILTATQGQRFLLAMDFTEEVLDPRWSLRLQFMPKDSTFFASLRESKTINETPRLDAALDDLFGPVQKGEE